MAIETLDGGLSYWRLTAHKGDEAWHQFRGFDSDIVWAFCRSWDYEDAVVFTGHLPQGGKICQSCYALNPESLGREVRAAWVEYCKEIGDTKPSHIAPWDELSDQDKEADRRIGEHIAEIVLNLFLGD